MARRNELSISCVLAFTLTGLFGLAQVIRTTVHLVVVPTTVTDGKGHSVDGLSVSDFQLLDNGIPQTIHLSTEYQPLSLAIVIQSNDNATPAVAKLRKIGSLIQPLITGERGRTAILLYDDDVRTAVPFTADDAVLTKAFRSLKAQGSAARMLDAVHQAIEAQRNLSGTRRVILVIGESKDRGSKMTLQEILGEAQAANVLIYSLTYSAFLMPFTSKPQDVSQTSAGGLNLIAIFDEIGRLGKENAAAAFAQYTGGKQFPFLKQRGLERAMAAIGDELHSQYILSFTPSVGNDGNYHELTVRVTTRPNAIVRSRPGYWLPKQ